MSIKTKIVNQWDLYIVFPLILILAILIRSFGLNWDEGFFWTPHPDERAILFKIQELSFPAFDQLHTLFDAQESSWNPAWFAYGSAPIYLMKFAGYVFSQFTTAEINDLRILGRILSSLADLGTLIFSFLLARKLVESKWTILVPAFIAIAVIHVQLSSFLTVDTFATFFTVATMYFLHRLAIDCQWTDSVFAGIFLGAGLATKISLMPIASVFIIAHLFYLVHPQNFSGQLLSLTLRATQVLKGVFLGIIATILVFLIAQPYALLDHSQFFADLREQSLMVRGFLDYPYTRQYFDTLPYLYHFKQLSVWGLGIPLAILSWLGLVYVLFRGLPVKISVAYIVFGLILPIMILVVFGNTLIVIVSAGVISATSLLFTLLFRTYESRLIVLSLCWVIPYILIWGNFEVKFLRYFLPIVPFLFIYGALFCKAFWEKVYKSFSAYSPRLVVLIFVVIVLGGTIIYSAGYINMRSEAHSAMQSSEWLQQHSDISSIVLREHWDEGLPLLRKPLQIDLPMYDPDTPQKTKLISDSLEKADFLVIYSNRLYGTISRLPDRYPMSRAYYQDLFNGDLGYELVHFESQRPHWGPFEFLDDTWSRSDLTPPSKLNQEKSLPLSISLGYADESFSVYTNPKVMIFQNVGRFSSSRIQEEILFDSFEYPQLHSSEINLMLEKQLLEIQRNGGTFSEIFDSESLANRIPIIFWIAFLLLLTIVGLPITFLIFSSTSDKGWLFSKPLGLLILGFSVWILCSFQLVEFSRDTIFSVLIVQLIFSLFLIVKFWDYFAKILLRNWKLFLSFECLFMIAFLAFVLIRMLNPDLWHPFRGGEKPMDFAYFNAVIKSTSMPPYDPWFSGGYMNYYYFGHFLTAMITKSLGILPEIAYNLSVPLFFSMTFGGIVSVVFNLCEWIRSSATKFVNYSRFFSLIAGVLGAFFVCVFGNFDGIIQLVGNTFTNHLGSMEFDYWKSSRMMPSSVEGITEFPFFTFLFADLHAHLMVMPFSILSLAISMSIIHQNYVSVGSGYLNIKAVEFGKLFIAALVLGALLVTNAWDYPTQILILAASILISEYIKLKGLTLMLFVRGSWKILIVAFFSILLFLPYHQNYETFFNGIAFTTHTTEFWRIVAIFGFPLLLIVSFYRSMFIATLRELTNKLVNWQGGKIKANNFRANIVLMFGGIIMLVVLIGLYSQFGLTLILMGILSAFVAYISISSLKLLDSKSGIICFLGLLTVASTSLIVGLEIFRVDGDIERMNSIFKFYLQIWVLLGVFSGCALWVLVMKIISKRVSRFWTNFWIISILLCVFSVSVYPVLATYNRINDRFESSIGSEISLDGLNFANRALFWDSDRPIYLGPDIGAARWMRQNVVGSPVILEAVTPQYLWGSRMSIYTGLPTIIGWEWHQSQQRWDYRSNIEIRANNVRTIYNSEDIDEVRELLDYYDVAYIIVGELERIYYHNEGLAKFDSTKADWLDLVYDSGGTRVYRYR
ncbi:MAG: DUF2298 domain-containing protein [Dehalococcoidia bacterium]